MMAVDILTSAQSDIMMTPVKTTLTLDDDVARKLKDTARRRQVPFEQIVNDTLRAGLAVKRKPRQVSDFARLSGLRWLNALR
jgi:predicted transcriptional regulator